MAAEASQCPTSIADMTELDQHDRTRPSAVARGRGLARRRFERARALLPAAAAGAAVALATAAAATASTPGPSIGLGRRAPTTGPSMGLGGRAPTTGPSMGLGGRAPTIPLTLTPGRAIVSVSLGASASRYFARFGALKIAQHAFSVSYGGPIVQAHVNKRGLVDAIASNSEQLHVYGQPLKLGFSRMSARLEHFGWREGVCATGGGDFASLGTRRQRHTYIVWRSHGVTVAIGTPHSAFVRAAADCKGLP